MRLLTSSDCLKIILKVEIFNFKIPWNFPILFYTVVYFLSHIWLFCDPKDCSPAGSSAHGILQARILEGVAIPFSRGSSWPREWTHFSCLAGRFFTTEAPEKPSILYSVQFSSVAQSCPTLWDPIVDIKITSILLTKVCSKGTQRSLKCVFNWARKGYAATTNGTKATSYEKANNKMILDLGRFRKSDSLCSKWIPPQTSIHAFSHTGLPWWLRW